MVNQCIQLFLVRHSIPVFYQRSCDLTDNWIKEQTSFNLKKAQQALLNKSLSFTVNRLFFSNKFHLIAAHIIITSNNKRNRVVNFICSVALPYQKTYAAELYRILAIMKLVEYYIMSFPSIINQHLIIHINLDCASVLTFFPFSMKIINNSTLK